jgi:hypothetical protein
MSGATKRIEEASAALEKGLIKKAMLLTDSTKTEEEHKLVVDIAKKCVSDKENCKELCKEGAVTLKDRITSTTDTNEGLEDLLKEEEERAQNTPSPQDTPKSPSSLAAAEAIAGEKPTTEMTPEEAYENCSECHIAAAAVEFVKIAEKDECDGAKVTEKLQPLLDDQNTTPEKWIKTMTEVAEKATCNKMKYGQVLGELTGYLQEKDSEILKNLDKG